MVLFCPPNIAIFAHRIAYMKFLTYLLSYPVIWLLSILPFPLLYLISDLLYQLLYHVVGYRKKVVRGNLNLAFPKKDPHEIQAIERKFYKHLCDMFLESTKSRSLSIKNMTSRYEIINPEALHRLESERSVMVLMAHYANWEWSLVLGHYIKTKAFGVYQRLGNPYFDRYVHRTRARWKLQLIEQQEATKTILANEESGIRGVYGLISDQSPMLRKARYWYPFMGVKVPVFVGGEYLAREGDMSVVYARITKKKRGRYALELITITEQAATLPEYEITQRFIHLVEEQIREEPHLYFWTHRRWKHRDKVPEAFRS